MGIHPDKADALLLLVIELGHPRDGSGGHRVIAADHNRRHPLFERLGYALGGLGAGLGNLSQIARILLAQTLGLGNGNTDIAPIRHLMAQRLKPRLKPGHAHGRWPHIDPTPRGSHIERHAEQLNFAGRERLRPAVDWTRRQTCDRRLLRGHLFAFLRHNTHLLLVLGRACGSKPDSKGRAAKR